MKSLQIVHVGQGVVGVFNERIKAPTRFPLVASLKGRSVPVLRSAPLLNAFKPQFSVSDDGHCPIRIAPAGRKNRLLSRPSQTFDEHKRMGGKQAVNPVTQPNGEDVFAMGGSEQSRHFSENMGRFFEAACSHFGPNHIAHGNHGDACRCEHRSKLALARAGHTANGHDLRHEHDAATNAQEDTSKSAHSMAQLENSARPHRRSMSFHKTAEANIKPTEMAIIPM